jgi:hypothetical protein
MAAIETGGAPQSTPNIVRTILLITVPFVLTAAAILPLMFIRPATTFDLTCEVDRFGWSLGGERNIDLFTPRRVRLQVDGFKQASFTVDDPTAENSPLNIRGGSRFSALNFQESEQVTLRVSPGSYLRLGWQSEESDRTDILIRRQGKSLPSIHAKVTAGAKFACTRCVFLDAATDSTPSDHAQNIPSAGNFDIQPLDTDVHIEIWPIGSAKLVDTDLPIADGTSIELFRNEEGIAKSALVNDASRLSLPNLDKELTFARTELVRLDNIQEAHVVEVSVSQNGIHARVAGRASKIERGSNAQEMHAANPSLLEIIFSNSKLANYYKAVVVIGTAILAILTRIKVLQKE